MLVATECSCAHSSLWGSKLEPILRNIKCRGNDRPILRPVQGGWHLNSFARGDIVISYTGQWRPGSGCCLFVNSSVWAGHFHGLLGIEFVLSGNEDFFVVKWQEWRLCTAKRLFLFKLLTQCSARHPHICTKRTRFLLCLLSTCNMAKRSFLTKPSLLHARVELRQ